MELVVSLAIFSLAIMVVLTLLSTGVQAQRKVLALQNVQENARFILEFMTKEIRMSNINAGNSSSLSITRPDGERIQYLFVNGNLERRTIPAGVGGPINSDSVSVNGSFYTIGIGTSDNLEPRATIVLSVQGKGTKTEEQAKIDLQTTLSQRTLDLP